MFFRSLDRCFESFRNSVKDRYGVAKATDAVEKVRRLTAPGAARKNGEIRNVVRDRCPSPRHF
jgi:hypothetical protein